MSGLGLNVAEDSGRIFIGRPARITRWEEKVSDLSESEAEQRSRIQSGDLVEEIDNVHCRSIEEIKRVLSKRYELARIAGEYKVAITLKLRSTKPVSSAPAEAPVAQAPTPAIAPPIFPAA